MFKMEIIIKKMLIFLAYDDMIYVRVSKYLFHVLKWTSIRWLLTGDKREYQRAHLFRLFTRID